ncbi:hypothetical protein F3Y22_tig00110156pilonHSYRG00339 [Hibiscus syriacus]|uniref:RNA-directed DNA polymerase n=1 Tax=Hibiscus syriacus TaxID=106335 RepID=A0A6A3BMK3_HIBSY|nr:hypothetical protein F3Y22_tig00110156pilonHSYRG00339 [Hibiscus syriacus]
MLLSLIRMMSNYFFQSSPRDALTVSLLLSVSDYPIFTHSGLTPEQSQNVQVTPVHVGKVHINPVGASVNVQPGSSSYQEEHQYHQVPDLDEEAKKDQNNLLEEKWKQLEREVRAMKEDTSVYGFDAKELSLVPDLVLPPKFKVPDFEKFDGTRCPSAHITMFCRKMTGYIGDDQLLIHCFQESLTGSAIRWYNQLSRANIKSWKDLAKSFLEQYKHVKDVRPNRMMLQGMEKKSNESFRQYAQRWRDVAVQVHPPLEEEETNMLFVNTLKALFFSHLIGNPYRSFADVILYDRHVVSPYHVTPMQPPFPKWYDASAQCEYHAGNPGHSIENCTAFKKVVQALRTRNVINFGDSEQPNIAQNPLPSHAGAGVNAITEEKGKRIVRNVGEVVSPMSWVWCQMVKVGLLKPSLMGEQFNSGEVCLYHNSEGHNIQQCPDFLSLVQDMMDSKEIEFFREIAEDEEAEVAPKVVITPPSPFPYRDNKQVPWRYDCQMGDVTKENEEIDEVGRFTRSGRCYSLNPPKESEKKVVVDKGKKVDVQIEEDKPVINEPVTESEAVEFLKFLKHSEYSVVEQLHKLPARISVLSLLLSSEVHRNALLKVLNQTFVPKELPIEKLDRLVSNVQADNFLSFSEDEIPSGMMGSQKALHITVKCKGYVLSRVLVDNGSALNVMPLVTLKKLPLDSTLMRTCQSVVRAFDGTKREVLGKIDVPLNIGPATYEVEFLVMDIMPTYNCLLGRPWIYQAGAVPSTLHQRLKFVIDGRLVCIHAEEDIIASVSTTAPYIEVDEQAVECSFRSLEFVNDTFVAEGKKIPKPRLSNCTKMRLKLTLGRGAKPTSRDKMRGIKKGQEIRKARLAGEDLSWEPMTFPPLSSIFMSGGHMFQGNSRNTEMMVENALGNLGINVITDDESEEMRAMGIYPAPPGFVLNNWTAEELPVVYKSFTESSNINNMNANDSDPEIDFEKSICQGEIEDCDDDEGCELPSELLKMVENEDKQILPHKESTEILNLGTDEDKREVKIGTTLSVGGRQDLIELLQEYKDVFAWSYEDMPGLDTELVVHKLPIKPECKPVQQKLRRMRPEMLLKIKEEVKKQFDAGFLKVAKYPEWVANIVPVPKKDGKVRMFVDYRDLNRASPKDNFPLPHIDTLVDNTAGNSLFSFMDGATYQRAMVTLFHDMMHKEIEVYVDDMIVKAKTEEEHIENLRKLFKRLRRCQLKLNPNKCTFGVTSGKLLGFVVSQKGIEIDPDKVKAIQDLPAPQTQKEVRGFLGRLNYIARFISQLTEKCDPIFRLLRKNNSGEWSEDCQRAFEAVKRYLSSTPILAPPISGKPLILYLSVYENSMGCVLGQRDQTEKKERAIYYLSKKFTECETRYSPIEKLCCALVWATRRLRQYMLYHTTWLISKLDPLKYLMGVPALSGRLARWQILLSEFDIQYVNQTAIKGSAIAEFIARRASEEYESLSFDFPDEDLMAISVEEAVASTSKYWKLNFDGASNAMGHGIGAILVSLEGEHYPFTSRLNFDCTNNMAEYEACVLGLRATVERKVKMPLPSPRALSSPLGSGSASGMGSPSSHRSSYSASSGSQLFSFNNLRSYSMSSLPQSVTPPRGPIKAQSSKSSFDLDEVDRYSSQKILKSQRTGIEELLSFRGVSLEREIFSVRCGLRGIHIPGRRWSKKLEIIQPVEIHSYAANCNTDDLLCVQIKNVSPAHIPNIVVHVDAITVVLEESSKVGPPASLPVACIEAGNDHSLPNLALRLFSL